MGKVYNYLGQDLSDTLIKLASPGGAIQFKHRQTIALECEDGYLQEDELWLQKVI